MSHLGIVLTGSPFDSQRWRTGYELARSALDSGHEVSIFAYLDGVYVPMKGQHFEEAAQDGLYQEMPSDLYQELLESGAKMFVCGLCVDARAVDVDSHLPDDIIVGLLPDLADVIGETDRVISL